MSDDELVIEFREMSVVAGLWCDRCLLPSGWRLRYGMFIEGEFAGEPRTIQGCTECTPDIEIDLGGDPQ